MEDEYFDRVVKIAEVKYQLSEDVLENFREDIEECAESGFSIRRTVEVIAEKIF